MQKYNHDIFNYRCQYSIHNLRKIAYISYREYSKINILSRACMRDLFIIQWLFPIVHFFRLYRI